MSRGKHRRHRSSSIHLKVFVASFGIIVLLAIGLIVSLHVLYPGR